MKTLGLIGGTSWFSTAEYYRLLNELANQKLGGASSAKLLLYSVDFSEFRPLAVNNEWDKIEKLFTGIAQRLEKAGADCLVLCANTPHIMADGIQRNISIPIIHIGVATAEEIKKHQLKKVALLGTKPTMEQNFIKEKLASKGIEAIIPGGSDRDFVHSSILEELTKGIFTTSTKARYLEVIENLRKEGAEGVIFGCTEIPMLIKEQECPMPSFDTTLIHAKAAVEFASAC